MPAKSTNLKLTDYSNQKLCQELVRRGLVVKNEFGSLTFTNELISEIQKLKNVKVSQLKSSETNPEENLEDEINEEEKLDISF